HKDRKDEDPPQESDCKSTAGNEGSDDEDLHPPAVQLHTIKECIKELQMQWKIQKAECMMKALEDQLVQDELMDQE
ncbi:hypothetical protein FQN51_002162, partial [Onygenales sp. PD_10]